MQMTRLSCANSELGLSRKSLQAGICGIKYGGAETRKCRKLWAFPRWYTWRICGKQGYIYREIFMNDDSDEEFLGFGPDDVNNNQDLAAETDSDSDNETDPMDELFTGNNGIKVDIPENPSPLDFIAIFSHRRVLWDSHISNQFLRNIISQITPYITPQRPPHSRFRKWPADGIPIEDMKCFISLLISMGLLHQEDIQDYWSKDDVFSLLLCHEIISWIYCHFHVFMP